MLQKKKAKGLDVKKRTWIAVLVYLIAGAVVVIVALTGNKNFSQLFTNINVFGMSGGTIIINNYSENSKPALISSIMSMNGKKFFELELKFF